MKKILFFMLIWMTGTIILTAQTDAINTYFERYLEDERFSSVYVSPKLIEIVSDIDFQALGEDELQDNEAAIITEVLNQLKGLMILKTEHEPMKFYQEALKNFQQNSSGFELLLAVRDDGENIRIWTKMKGNTISELLLLVGGTDEMMMLSLTGNIDLKKISKLAGGVNVDGIEYLKHIEN